MTQAPKPRRRRLFPRPLSECVGTVTAPALEGRGKLQQRLLRDWREITRGTVAAHGVPQTLSFPKNANANAMLTLAIPSAFALEAQHLEPKILERLSTYLGYAAVSRIKLVPLPPESVRPPVEKETALSKALANLAQKLQNQEAL